MMEVSHDPEETRRALEIAVTAYVDLETTGIERHDQVVSAGLLINNNIYILFLRSVHRTIRNLPTRPIPVGAGTAGTWRPGNRLP